jgi:uracil-DNA glycosylase
MHNAWLDEALPLADVSWRPVLLRGLEAMNAADPAYLPALAQDEYLPTKNRLFAAFAQPLDAVRYVLVGEGPYPREESATGVCFMDGAVGALWSSAGLSKQVNRATSLRNFMKMLMVADGLLTPESTTGEAVTDVAQRAQAPDAHFIQTLPELQNNLHANGFLLLNAALVFRPHVPPAKEAKAWQPLLDVVLEALANAGFVGQGCCVTAGDGRNQAVSACGSRTPVQPFFYKKQRHAATVRSHEALG